MRIFISLFSSLHVKIHTTNEHAYVNRFNFVVIIMLKCLQLFIAVALEPPLMKKF
jgi:hypothetical protein